MTHIVLSTNTGYGLKYVLKYSLHYIPPTKLCYVPIAQHDVGWSSGVQMSYILLVYLSEINTFSYDILWLDGCCLTSGKNNKAVNDQKISVYYKNNMEVHPLFSMCTYRCIFSIIILFNNKVASLTSVIFLNTGNKLSSLN